MVDSKSTAFGSVSCILKNPVIGFTYHHQSKLPWQKAGRADIYHSMMDVFFILHVLTCGSVYHVHLGNGNKFQTLSWGFLGAYNLECLSVLQRAPLWKMPGEYANKYTLCVCQQQRQNKPAHFLKISHHDYIWGLLQACTCLFQQL